MVRGGSQVLPNGDNVDANVGKVGQHSNNFVVCFAHTHNQTRFHRKTSRSAPRQHRQASCVPSTWTYGTLQSWNSFHVVIEHVGSRIDQHIERCSTASV
jgi:hypothetical protein